MAPCEPERPRERLVEHLLATLSLDWSEPPPDVQRLLQRVSALPWAPDTSHEAYLERVDGPAHADPAREARYREALVEVRGLADRGAALDLPLVTRVQGLVLGRPAAFRRGAALARGGREAYALFPELEAMLRRKLRVDAADGCHPLVQACRLYLDLIFVHPFEDGNARAARLWWEFLLRRARTCGPRIEELVRWEKVPGDAAAAWRLVRFCAQRALARHGCHTRP